MCVWKKSAVPPVYFCRLNEAPKEIPVLPLALKSARKVCRSRINHEVNCSSCGKGGCCFLFTLCWFYLGRWGCKWGLCSCKSAFQGPLGAHYFEKHSLAWLLALSIRLVGHCQTGCKRSACSPPRLESCMGEMLSEESPSKTPGQAKFSILNVAVATRAADVCTVDKQRWW